MSIRNARSPAWPHSAPSARPVATSVPAKSTCIERCQRYLESGGSGTVGQIAKALGDSTQAVFKAVEDLRARGHAKYTIKTLDLQGLGYPRECRVWCGVDAEEPEPGPNLTIVQSALLKQPALATVWGARHGFGELP